MTHAYKTYTVQCIAHFRFLVAFLYRTYNISHQLDDHDNRYIKNIDIHDMGSDYVVFYDFMVIYHDDDFENFYVEHRYNVDCSTCNGFCRPKMKEKPNNDSKRKRSIQNPIQD